MIIEKRQKEIETIVNRRQWKLLENANFPKNSYKRFDALNIERAITSEGYSIQEVENIPTTSYGAEAVGYLDKVTKTVYIKLDISQERKNFTLAHELGHILMHKDMQVMHRQVARKKGHPRPKLEQEADYFASCWLMPKLLVIKHFQMRFLLSPLIFTDNVAHLLKGNGEEQQELLEATQSSGLREIVLAKSTNYNSQSFPSMASFFKISPDSMAIRLQELGLVIYP